MRAILEVTYRDVPKTEEVENLIRENVEKLERICDHLSSCRVSLEKSMRRRHSHNPYHVRVNLTVPPGHELVASHEPGNDEGQVDLHLAVRRAFDHSGRQLSSLVERQRGEVKTHPEQQAAGIVAKLFREEGYGFIKTLEGQDLYFHRNSVWEGEFDRLEVGTGVHFAESQGEHGPQASTVRIVDKPGKRVSETGGEEVEVPLGWKKT